MENRPVTRATRLSLIYNNKKKIRGKVNFSLQFFHKIITFELFCDFKQFLNLLYKSNEYIKWIQRKEK